jgi:hypothetical protein
LESKNGQTRAIGGINMKAHFSGLVVLVLWLTATPAGALNDAWLKDDQAFLQNQMSQYQNEISQLESVKQSANISKLNIAAGNGSASDYANVAMWEAQKHQYKHLNNQMTEARHALHKVNNRINELGTRRPPQQHDPYGGSSGGCGSSGQQSSSGGCGSSGQSYYERSSPDQGQSSTRNAQGMHQKHSQSKMAGHQHSQSKMAGHQHSKGNTSGHQHSQNNMAGHQHAGQTSTHRATQHHATANKKKQQKRAY